LRISGHKYGSCEKGLLLLLAPSNGARVQQLHPDHSFKTTPVAALQVEMNEMPLEIGRNQIAVTYWASLKGHKEVTRLRAGVKTMSRNGKVTD